MIVKIKKYIAKVAEFKEHMDGSISKEIREIALNGKRFSASSIERRIPRGAILVESGWRELSYEVDTEKLEKFLDENGEPVTDEK